jgi:hypothetical protein
MRRLQKLKFEDVPMRHTETNSNDFWATDWKRDSMIGWGMSEGHEFEYLLGHCISQFT